MGTYLLGTIYDVIAPFLLEMGKNVPDWKWSAWNLLRFCLFRISLASLLRILQLFKLFFFPKVSLHFWKFLRHERVKDITTTFAYWEKRLSTAILPSLLVIVNGIVDIWTKQVTGCQKHASTLRNDLDGELVVERNYRKTLFAFRIHTLNAWKALICLTSF